MSEVETLEQFSREFWNIVFHTIGTEDQLVEIHATRDVYDDVFKSLQSVNMPKEFSEAMLQKYPGSTDEEIQDFVTTLLSNVKMNKVDADLVPGTAKKWVILTTNSITSAACDALLQQSGLVQAMAQNRIVPTAGERRLLGMMMFMIGSMGQQAIAEEEVRMVEPDVKEVELFKV